MSSVNPHNNCQDCYYPHLGDEGAAPVNPGHSSLGCFLEAMSSFSHYTSHIPRPLLISAQVSSKTPLVDSLNKHLLGTKYQARS